MSIEDFKTVSKNLKSAELSFEIAKIDFRIEKMKIEILELQRQKEDYEKHGLRPEHTNPLTAFLSSNLVTFGNNGKDSSGTELYVREKVFVATFNDFCRDKKYNSCKWTSQFYSEPFTDFNIKIAKNCNKRYPNRPGAETFGGLFFIGVDVVPTDQSYEYSS
jgi:hypothetical protein